MNIELTNVGRTYRTKHKDTQALSAVSLSIPAGDFLCILGPSGCGKSTLLNILAGLESYDIGSIVQDGARLNGCSPERIMMFQDAGLFPWFSVEENVAFGLKAAGKHKLERQETVRHFLEMVGLYEYRRSFIHELSGGMRQRVALARALCMEPKILLMDEPFAALDAMTRDALHIELQDIWQKTGCTIVFVTHNVREALILGNRVLLMAPNPGRIFKDYRIDLPRPRHFEDDGIVELARIVLADMKIAGTLTQKVS